MTAESDDLGIAGRRFRTFFTAVCIDLRDAARASEERVADRIGVSSNSVRRFEKGEVFPTENLDRYAAGYAAIVQPPIDPRDIFERATAWWRAAGLEPLTKEESEFGEEEDREPSPRAVVAAIRRAEESEREGRVQAGRQPTATRSRRRGAG